MSRFFYIIITLLCFSTLSIRAQELNARVTVNSDRIQATNKNIFTTLEKSLNNLINDTQWSSTTFTSAEKIECTFTITILEQNDNSFKAELFVQSRRPVFNSSYNTTLLNFRDTNVEFEYRENDVIQIQENTLSNNIEAVIRFYTNLILGLDFDSFSLLGGSVFFRNAQSIANMAQSFSWNGWSSFENNRYRGAIINAFLDETLKNYRQFWYTYHRKGLDEMSANPDRGRITILEALPVLKDIKQVRSSEILLQMFADSKLDEVVSVAEKATKEEKKETYDLLRNIFPSMSSQLEPLKK
ncbi:DUF4835 family protein [Bacteroidales bacterium OttesenSCG-928-M06]|nr:DUF4835 family protein [Bacteroidales bacterium OttesenSCG-928-M06]